MGSSFHSYFNCTYFLRLSLFFLPTITPVDLEVLKIGFILSNIKKLKKFFQHKK